MESSTTTRKERVNLRARSAPAPAASNDQHPRWLGFVFGIAFGFLLQKGGVAKYHVLMGQLLLADFTVVKVMLSAVVVGMLGIHSLHRAGLVEMHIKPTQFAANSLGGLLFGCGFALSAYCPGTSAAALGQGNLDALAVIAGLFAGSYLFAEASGWLGEHVNPIGHRGKLTLHELLPFNRTAVTLSVASFLVLVLVGVHLFAVR